MSLSHILKGDKMEAAAPNDTQPTGQYFTVSWRRLENILKGRGPELLVDNEYILGAEATEAGVRICIGETNND